MSESLESDESLLGLSVGLQRPHEWAKGPTMVQAFLETAYEDGRRFADFCRVGESEEVSWYLPDNQGFGLALKS